MPEPEPTEDAHVADTEITATDGADPDEPAEYANRAARRAKGKTSSQPQPHGTSERQGGRGSVQSPRQWGTRRSG